MTYRVQLSPRAAKAYQKLDSSVIRTLIQTGIDALQHNPLTSPQVKRLKGRLHTYYRYRAGDYRIIYAVDQKGHMVYVDYIQRRREIYRNI